jgi:hypothetical protein
MPYLHNTLNSLTSQTIKPTKIYVFLPKKSKRFNTIYDINTIQHEKINDPDEIIEFITDINDEGPITKFYKLLDLVHLNQNNQKNHSYLFLVDDDVIYPKNRIYNLKKNIYNDEINHKINYGNQAYGFSGRIYFTRCKKPGLKYIEAKKNYKVHVDVLETFNMVAYPRNIFPETSQEFIEWVHQLPSDAFYVDDIVLSYWCKLHNCKRVIYYIEDSIKFYSDVDNIPEEVKKKQLLEDNVIGGRNEKVFKELFINKKIV